MDQPTDIADEIAYREPRWAMGMTMVLGGGDIPAPRLIVTVEATTGKARIADDATPEEIRAMLCWAAEQMAAAACRESAGG